MFDVSCITFSYECGVHGNCWIYDNNELSLYTFSLIFPCAVIAFIILLFHWIFYPKQTMTIVKESTNIGKIPRVLMVRLETMKTITTKNKTFLVIQRRQ